MTYHRIYHFHMFKALILWLFSAGVTLGCLAFGFCKWAELEAQNQRNTKLEQAQKKIQAQQTEINRIIQNAEKLNYLKAHLGVSKGSELKLIKKNGSIVVKDQQIISALESYVPQHIDNSAVAIYLRYVTVNEVSVPFLVLVRSATASEAVEVRHSDLVAYFIPKQKLAIAMDIGSHQFIYDSSNTTFSQNIPSKKYSESLRKTKEDLFNYGNDRYGGEILIRKHMQGVTMKFVAHFKYGGWESQLVSMTKQKNWQIMLLGLGVGLLSLLVGLLYYADSLGILEKKIGEFNTKFQHELKRILSEELEEERQNALQDISEGVRSVLKSPMNSVRENTSDILSGLTEKQIAEKVGNINMQLDRMDKLLEAINHQNSAKIDS